MDETGDRCDALQRKVVLDDGRVWSWKDCDLERDPNGNRNHNCGNVQCDLFLEAGQWCSISLRNSAA